MEAEPDPLAVLREFFGDLEWEWGDGTVFDAAEVLDALQRRLDSPRRIVRPSDRRGKYRIRRRT